MAEEPKKNEQQPTESDINDSAQQTEESGSIKNQGELNEKEAGPPEDQEEPNEEEVGYSTSGGMLTNLLSPGGLIMLMIAALLDLTGIVIICVGLDDFGIFDIVGTLTIGGWMLLKPPPISSDDQELTVRQLGREAAQKRQERKKIVGQAKKATKGMRWLRPICFIGELIPFVGALPFWTIMVFNELKSRS